MSRYYRSILSTLGKKNPDFQILVKTDNTGVSGSDTILLPIQGTSMFIDWGDGNTQTTTQANTPNNTIGGNNVSHTYASAGNYVVKISVGLERILFANGGDRLKLLEIQNWGDIVWGANQSNSYFGCANMQVTAIDAPNLSIVTNINGFFRSATTVNFSMFNWGTSNITSMADFLRGATSFNGNISGLDVSSVTSFNQFLDGATAFNQNLGSYTLSGSLTTLVAAFRSTSMSTANYTDTIVAWANYVFDNSNSPSGVSMTTQTSRTFDNSRSGGVNFADAGAARTYLTTTAGWTISGDTVI